MEAVATLAQQPTRWSLRKLYATTTAIIGFLVIAAPTLYNSDSLFPVALGLLAALLLLGSLATGLFGKNLLRQQRQRALAWLLLAGLNFAGWWVGSRIASEAMIAPLSPDAPALGALLYHTFAPYFSS
jgi:hypothetical protein